MISDEKVLDNYIRAIYGEMPVPEDADGYDVISASEAPFAQVVGAEEACDDWGLCDWGGAPCS